MESGQWPFPLGRDPCSRCQTAQSSECPADVLAGERQGGRDESEPAGRHMTTKSSSKHKNFENEIQQLKHAAEKLDLMQTADSPSQHGKTNKHLSYVA